MTAAQAETVARLRAACVMASTAHFGGLMSSARNAETGRHQARTARIARRLCLQLARHFQLSDTCIEIVTMACSVHDLGKVSLPDDILLKPGRLDAAEVAAVRGHCDAGWGVLSRVFSAEGVLDTQYADIFRRITRGHHERMDGSGYPDGISGQDIWGCVRIAAVADVYDALTSPRPYKPALTIAEATAEILTERGIGLDAAVVDAMIELAPEVALDITEHRLPERRR